MIDVEKALLDPGLVFKTPEEALASNELSREQRGYAARNALELKKMLR